MSFSVEAKAELCRAGLGKPCCAVAEAYGTLLYANSFSAREIRIITGSTAFAQRLPRLFKKAFGFGFDAVAEGEDGAKSVLSIVDGNKIRTVFGRFGYDADSTLVHHINLGVLEEDCCRAAFLRGAFLAGGSMSDPSKRCHLELVTDHKNVAGETFSLLLEMGFSPRDTVRAGNYVIYFKRSEQAEDLFTTMGASGAAMELMNAKVEKDMRNAINRRVNCDSANADKIVFAAQTQLERIRTLEREVGLEKLPGELQALALLRIANPEASLSDLAALSDPPLTKSGINHRMRKLMGFEVK